MVKDLWPIQQADLEVRKIRGQGCPQIDLSFGASASLEPELVERLPDLATRSQSRTIDNAVALNASQPLYQFGYRIALIEAAELRAEAAWINVSVIQRQLFSELAAAYIDAVGLANQLGILAQEQAELEKLLTAEERRMEQGFSDMNDALAVASELSTAKLNFIQGQQQVLLAQQRLRVLIVRRHITILSDDFSWLERRMPHTLDQAKLWALHNHLEVLAAEKQAEAALLEQAATNRSTLPQLSWTLNHERGLRGTQFEFTAPTVNQRRDTQVGLILRVPLFRGGSNKALRDSAKMSSSVAIRQVATVRERVLIEVEQAWIAMQQYDGMERQLNRALAQERAKLGNAQRLRDSGFLDLRSTLKAHQAVRHAQSALT